VPTGNIVDRTPALTDIVVLSGRTDPNTVVVAAGVVAEITPPLIVIEVLSGLTAPNAELVAFGYAASTAFEVALVILPLLSTVNDGKE